MVTGVLLEEECIHWFIFCNLNRPINPLRITITPTTAKIHFFIAKSIEFIIIIYHLSSSLTQNGFEQIQHEAW
jgi:hypothetical protein